MRTNQINNFISEDMKELIPISEQNGKKAVSARVLHEFLESKRDFSNWMKDRIKKYGLIEDQDYTVFNNFGENPNGGRPLTEYALSLDCAKELAMVEGNAKGKQARQYFIECERIAQDKKPLSQIEFLVQSAQILLEQDKRINNVENKVLELEAKTQTRPDYFTVVGFGSLNGIPVNLGLASRIGQKASRICKDRGFDTDSIPDPRFGQVKMYPKSVLEEVFNQIVY